MRSAPFLFTEEAAMKINRMSRSHGITSLLAMLFLVLFSTLAIGFYAATTVSSQVSANDDRIARAFMAAESGMEFIKYQLGRVSIPPHTAVDQVMNQLYADLQTQLNGTANLGAYTISKTGNTITIPGNANGKINLDSNGDAGFRITITDWAGEIVVKSDGTYRGTSGASRSITMDFSRAQKTTTIFDYAIASKGQIQMKKGSVTSITGVDPSIAQMMSAQAANGAITVTGGTIGGDLSHVDGGDVVITGGSVGGSSIASVIQAQHVHEVDPPEFPIVDPTVYKKYATSNWID
jgi:Tfp pilus assembly protein PilX